MDIKNEIRHSFVSYFGELLDAYNVEKGYHDLSFTWSASVVQFTLECIINSDKVNKLIPEISVQSIKELLSMLRHKFLEYDFIVQDVVLNTLKFVIRLYVGRLYLSLSLFPVDMILEISKYLDTTSYNNLLEVIKVERYPELLRYF